MTIDLIKEPLVTNEFYEEGLRKIPEHMHEAVRAYVMHGIRPGGFLSAVLMNLLVESFSRADSDNQRAMRAWASFVYSDLPRTCHGSSDAVEAWIKSGGIYGMRRAKS